MKSRLLKGILAMVLLCATLLTGCQSTANQVVIYSNADDEAVTAMKNALYKNGYEGNTYFKLLEQVNYEGNYWLKEQILKLIWLQ